MTAYTKISKATGTSYTYVNTIGKEMYDEPESVYDDSLAFYDSTNMSLWTSVPAPAKGAVIVISAGMATGLLMPPTYAQSHSIDSDNWTRIPKAT